MEHPGPDHQHGHPHTHSGEPGPLADASVRIGRESDAPAVGFVQAVVFRATYAAHLPSEVVAQFEPRPFTNAWRASLAQPPSRDHVLLVACAGQQVVGFASVAPSSDPDAGERTAELTTIAVHPDARRQGHGSRLLNAVVDTARGRGRDELTTWLLGSDDDTRAFLVGAGMVPDGAHRSRVVASDGATLAEVRLSADVSQDPRSV